MVNLTFIMVNVDRTVKLLQALYDLKLLLY